MHVTPLVWIVTLSVLTAILAFDVIMMIRRPHEPSMKEATIWISIYVMLAVMFGIGIGWNACWWSTMRLNCAG